MDDTLLQKLLTTDDPAEKAAIVAEAVLDTLSEETALVARRCVLLHWFDQSVVEALAQDVVDVENTPTRIYEQIASLPFIESLPWGLAFNALTREGLIHRYTATQPQLLRTAARLAAATYRRRGEDEKIAAEAFFCYTLAGEMPLALEVLNELLERTRDARSWEYIHGLLGLQDEAQQMPFVDSLQLRKIQQKLQRLARKAQKRKALQRGVSVSSTTPSQFPSNYPSSAIASPITSRLRQKPLSFSPISQRLANLISFFALFGLLITLVFVYTFVHLGAGGTTPPPPGSSGPTKAAANKQIAILPESGISDIATFDPGLSTDLPSIAAIDMVFTGLVQLDDKLEVKPQLATSYSVAADGLTWTFHLRPNLKFSDGSPLTSADVAYSIDRALQPSEKSTVGPIYLALIKDSDKLVAGKIKTIINDSIMTPDPSTVVLVTNKKATYFLDALTYSCSYVVEKSLVDKYGNTTFTDHLDEGGGDGPFKVASYTSGQNIVFVPNPNYYGPIPQLAKVVYPFYKDTETAYIAYQVGQVDTASVPSAQLAAARKLTNEYHQVPQLWINYYAMNYLVKPFDNIKIRQAFELAINKDLIVHTVWKDRLIATNHIVPEGQPGYNRDLWGPDGVPGTAGDPAKAKALFQAGLQEEGMTLSTLPPIRLTYSSGDKDSDNEVAALQQMWQNVLGVSVKADPIDFNKLLSEITAATNNPKGLQFWGSRWIAGYPDPQNWTTLQFGKGVPNNSMNYGQNNTSDAAQQQAVQQALKAADVAPARDTRLQAYYQAEQQLVNDVAWLPMEQVTLSILRKPCLAVVVDNPQGLIPPDDWGAVYISTATPCADTSSFQ